MNKFASITKPLVWFMTFFLAAVMAGCGSGSSSNAPSLVSIAVTPVAAIIAVSGTQQLAATGTYSDMSTAAVTASWTSATPTVATVSSTGLVTGVANGTSVITATFGGKTTTATMTVSSATLSSIAVTTLTPTLTISIGGTKQFIATGTYSDASTLPVAATWTSANTSIATLSPSTAGLATGVTNGSSLITATFGGKTASATLTVSAAAATSVLPGIAGSAGANATNPTVISANPSNGDTNVPISIRGALHTNLVGPELVTATFSGAMDQATINSATPGALNTFTLKDMTTGAGSIVSGTVAMNTANTIATFTPTANLTPGTNYTASISTAAKNTGSVTAMPKTVSWSFTTRLTSSANQANPFVGQAPIDLLTAGNFVILAQTAITETGTFASAITGNVGLSAGAASAIGIRCSEVGIYTVYGVDPGYTGNGGLTACFKGTAAPDITLVNTAVGDKGTAYGEASGRTLPDATNLGVANIGGLTFYPGLYKWTGAIQISGGNVTLDAQGDSNAVWIFQMAGDLTVPSSGALPGTQVILAGGAKASNIFWQVAGSSFGATIGTYNTFNGNILSSLQVILQTGAILNGRALAATQVVLDANPVTQPAP